MQTLILKLRNPHNLPFILLCIFGAVVWLLYAKFNTLLSLLVGCSNEIETEIISPDNKLKAVVFNRNCGATVAENVQVYVCKKNESLPDDGGNVFIEDGNDSYDKHVLVTNVKWLGPKELSISYNKMARIFKQKDRIEVSKGLFQNEMIKVTYKPFSYE